MQKSMSVQLEHLRQKNLGRGR